MSMIVKCYIESDPLCFPVKLQAGADKNGNPIYEDCYYKSKFQYWVQSNEIKLKEGKK